MRRRIKNLKPEAFLLGESPADNNQAGVILDIFNNKFDAAYDWELRGFGTGALNSLLSGTSSNVSTLNSVIAKTYPVNDYPMRMMEDHDFSRATVEFGLKQSKLGHAVVFTVNGIPLIYGGGEVGELTQLNPITWTDPNNFKPYFQKLLGIRRKYIRNDDTVIMLSNTGSALVDSWLTKSDSTLILTLANFTGSSASLTVNFSGNVSDTSLYVYDLLNDTSLHVTASGLNSLKFTLAGLEAGIYSLQKSVPTSVKDNPALVYSFKLSQNYPNPFNPSTVIRYSVPEHSKVTLKIYDITGRELMTLLDKDMNPGEYEINFNASRLATGVYFYTLRSNAFALTKKMLLLK
jgi:hypothetical protein